MIKNKLERQLEAWHEITSLVKKANEKGSYLKPKIDSKVTTYIILYNERYDINKKPNPLPRGNKE